MEELLVSIIINLCSLNAPKDYTGNKSDCAEKILNCAIEYNKDIISEKRINECIRKYKEELK